VNMGGNADNGTPRVRKYAEVRIINAGYYSSSELRCSNDIAREYAT
jgi:hypothetical protein